MKINIFLNFKLLIKKRYFMHQDFYGLDCQHYTTRRLVYQRKSDIKRTIVYLIIFFKKLFMKMLTQSASLSIWSIMFHLLSRMFSLIKILTKLQFNFY